MTVFFFFFHIGPTFQELYKQNPTASQCLWQVWRLLEDLLWSPRCVRHDRPSSQSQRWKISSPWVPFRLCLVQTWPSFRTGLQILDQKWRAQHSPSAQSEDLKQVSPSRPETLKNRPNRGSDQLDK